MKTSQAGIDLIKQFEGLKLEPYLCSARVPTIGYGATFYPNGVKVSLKDNPINVEDAEELLKITLRTFENGVSRLVKFKLNQPMFDALVCFSYNVGPGNLQVSTLLRKLNRGNIWDCPKEFLKWNKDKAGGVVLKGLVRRRVAEKALFEKGLLEY
jgi:lysozyme